MIVISVIILVLDYLRPADMNKFFGTTSEFVVANDEAEVSILLNQIPFKAVNLLM